MANDAIVSKKVINTASKSCYGDNKSACFLHTHSGEPYGPAKEGQTAKGHTHYNQPEELMNKACRHHAPNSH